MLREEYLRRLIDASPVELYLSANDGARIYWPCRMQPPKEANTTYRNACEKYIIDSNPLDDSVTNVDVLNTAAKLGAEVASLQDVYQDKPATVDSLLDGLSVADAHEFDGQLLLPLQKPYVECWEELGEPTEHILGIGGLKDSHATERIEAVKALRNAVGDTVWIHGFGWGLENGMAEFIRQNPEMLDSLDYSSPMQQVNYSDYENGEESMSVAAMQAATQLVADLRRCSDFVERQPEELRDSQQASLF